MGRKIACHPSISRCDIAFGEFSLFFDSVLNLRFYVRCAVNRKGKRGVRLSYLWLLGGGWGSLHFHLCYWWGVEDGEANKISRMDQDLSRLPRHLNTERSFNIKWARREILSVVLLAFFHSHSFSLSSCLRLDVTQILLKRTKNHPPKVSRKAMIRN